MPKSKVLIVDSVDDEITHRRHVLLATSELLESVAIEYCYAIDLTESEKTELRFGLSPNFELTESSLFERVDFAVSSFQPDFVMVHSGFVYRRFTETYKSAFSRLKKLHPRLLIGIQLRPGMEVDSGPFDTNSDVQRIHDLIFIQAVKGRG